jgi:ubiquinone/menaquinone biosynthesis C-methylase UbiE
VTDRPTAYDVAGHYDAAYYDDLARRYRTRNRFARQRLANVLSLLPPLAGRTLVDIGCGMGTFTIEAARAGGRAIGVDFAPEALPAAAAVARAEQTDRAWFARADAVRLPLRDGSADVVVAADLTEHLDDATLDGVLRDAARVLAPGGTLVLYTPEHAHLFERLRDAGVMKQDPSHIGIRTAAELAHAVRASGLHVTSVRWLPSHLPGLQLLERALGRWVPLLRRRIGIVATRP